MTKINFRSISNNLELVGDTWVAKSRSKISYPDEANEMCFHVEYATYIFSILPVPIFLFRSLPQRLKLIKKRSSKETYKREHSQPGGMMGKLLKNTLKKERKRIRHKKMIPFGSSCLIAAKKGSAFEEAQ
jgi:hypothetical protein